MMDNIVPFQRPAEVEPQVEPTPRLVSAEFFFDSITHGLTLTRVDPVDGTMTKLWWELSAVSPPNFDWAEHMAWWQNLPKGEDEPERAS